MSITEYQFDAKEQRIYIDNDYSLSGVTIWKGRYPRSKSQQHRVQNIEDIMPAVWYLFQQNPSSGLMDNIPLIGNEKGIFYDIADIAALIRIGDIEIT